MASHGLHRRTRRKPERVHDTRTNNSAGLKNLLKQIIFYSLVRERDFFVRPFAAVCGHYMLASSRGDVNSVCTRIRLFFLLLCVSGRDRVIAIIIEECSQCVR